MNRILLAVTVGAALGAAIGTTVALVQYAGSLPAT